MIVLEGDFDDTHDWEYQGTSEVTWGFGMREGLSENKYSNREQFNYWYSYLVNNAKIMSIELRQSTSTIKRNPAN